MVALIGIASGLAAILRASTALRITALIACGLAIAGAAVEVAMPSRMFQFLASYEFLEQMIKAAISLSLAAMGGALTERAGVIDLALEAKLLFGAFTAAAIAIVTGSAYVGVAGGMLAGMVVASAQLGFALRLGANQVIIGVALNLLALGGTRFLLQLIFHEGSNSPKTPTFDSTAANPILWLAIASALLLPFALRRTRWGLRLRAAGDRPDSLVSVGVSPTRARFAAGLVGGALAGAGGAQLSLSVAGFTADSTGGRGYMALAMVILAGWRPAWAAVACLAVAMSGALESRLQMATNVIPRELAPLLPYVLTLIVVIVVGGNRKIVPRALGKL
jgi:simple sugar transport system permease protein